MGHTTDRIVSGQTAASGAAQLWAPARRGDLAPGDGGYAELERAGLEQERHRTFEHLRLTGEPRPGGTEWFRPGQDLQRFIDLPGGAR
jgi:hypothetical protein